MITKIFLVIEFLLKLFKLWEEFGVYIDRKRTAEAHAKEQRRNEAVEESKKADTDEDIWASQEDITDNLP